MNLNEKGADVPVSEEQIFRILEDAIVYDNPTILGAPSFITGSM